MKKLLSIAVLMLLAGCSGMSNESDSITKFPSVIISFYQIEYVVYEIEH